jgi:outer membrane protein assembly factor BamD (BamD/ComL family)
LEEEAQLLGTAQQRISQGDARGALSVLAEHQKQFPRGALSLERQATVAIAHCLSGQTSKGRGEAERFRRKHPNSPMVKRLESACKLESP